ncbi:LPS export ABC transporter periplasmic protein LptC [Sunxiuqinia dokdonensis]|uniref:LPS export ABC transporter periplasmic protein LptC n=1 Tax=Sunxiuqinia dokdonensis TaxID=1409788 RepID=UPI00138F6D19|nr:LPS export ABC transporter periplasmic protein LptC [Sunxiuqinia dokdonensis]
MKQPLCVLNKRTQGRYDKGSIAILIAGIAMLFFSCANKIEKIKEFSSGENMAGVEAENYEMIHSDSTIVRFKLITPKLIRFDKAEDPFIEFPEGVEIERYNEQMEQIASITSNYARYFEAERKWEAKNNVVAVNPQGDTLKTEHLIWEEQKAKIYSEQFVKIIRKDQVITGIGFESDQNLSNWKIKNPKGPLYIEVEE